MFIKAIQIGTKSERKYCYLNTNSIQLIFLTNTSQLMISKENKSLEEVGYYFTIITTNEKKYYVYINDKSSIEYNIIKEIIGDSRDLFSELNKEVPDYKDFHPIYSGF